MKYFIQVAILIATIWGSTPFLTKHILKNIHYKTLIMIETILTIMISSVFTYYNRSEIIDDFKNIDCTILCAMLVLTFCAFFVNILYYNIIKDHDPHLVTSITSIYPLIALFISYLFLKQDITYWKFLGIVLITSGIICIVK